VLLNFRCIWSIRKYFIFNLNVHAFLLFVHTCNLNHGIAKSTYLFGSRFYSEYKHKKTSIIRSINIKKHQLIIWTLFRHVFWTFLKNGWNIIEVFYFGCMGRVLLGPSKNFGSRQVFLTGFPFGMVLDNASRDELTTNNSAYGSNAILSRSQ
jgi:hypothetical protein